jgi:signal transduction histidine kinase
MKKVFVWDHSLDEIKTDLKTPAENYKRNLQLSIMSADSTRSREEIVRLIIHEIRNPLSAISLANQLMVETAASGQVHPESITVFTEIIGRNASRIEQQLQELLHENRDETSYRRIKVGEIIDDALTHVADRIKLQKITIHKLYSGREIITGNGQLLSVAFLNLLVNAIEAVDKKDGEIWISIYERGDKTEVSFRDNGKGMKKEQADRVFDPHYSSKPNGLGMGLAHVRKILKEHHATVTLDTAPGKGAAFVIAFNN